MAVSFVSEEQQWWYNCTLMLREMGYTASEVQDEILRCKNRIILLSGGEQAGKSMVAAMYLLTRMPYGKIFWMVGDDYEQSHKEFTYVVDALAQVNAVRDRDISMPMRGAWQLKAFGGSVQVVTKTADDIRKLAKDAPDGILINEAAQCGYDVYLKCLGRTAPKRGWLFMSGTLESSTDWYAESLKRWQSPNAEDAKSFVIPSWANPVLYPGGREDPEIKRIEALLDRELFLMRFGAVPTPPEGLVLPQFSYKTHVPGDVTYNKELPVQVWIDPGYSGSNYAVEAVQLIDCDDHCEMVHVHVIDELYVKFGTTGMIIEECKTKEWWDNLEQAVIDVAGSQHHAQSSHAEMWGAQELPVLYEKVPVEDGITRHHTFLKDPGTGVARIYYNENCSGAIKEYGKWKRTKVTGLTNQAAKPQLINCDALKAIQYGLIANFGYVEYDGEEAVVANPFSF